MIGESVQRGLRQDGYAVDWVRDGVAAERALADHGYDLVLLDLGLPRKDGIRLLDDLRRRQNRVPVLVLTARDAISDRVRGLDAGADDYLVKPFAPEELVARLRAVCRRSAGVAQQRLRLRMGDADVEADLARRAVWRAGQRVELTAREWTLLEALLLRAGRIVAKGDLERLVLGSDAEVASNALEVHVSSLRRKLGRSLIETVRGLGYRLEVVVP